MTIFDLLFIAAFLATVAAVLTAAYFAFRGKPARGSRIVRNWALSACIYIGVVVLVSLAVPRRVLGLGDSRCYDDWCISIDSVKREPSSGQVSYLATLKLSSRARRVSQRENNLAVYLTDDRGRRYGAIPEESEVPLNALLGPQESISATRTFKVPADAQGIGVVIAHEGGFPVRWLIIGEEGWFRKPTIVPVP